jgi:L-alanine-DL-glutamate epimerase-like enolase superfamily enzyme
VVPPSALWPSKVEARVYRAPLDRPVRASFGTMTTRPLVLVRVEDRDGTVGWGESWCNFPTCGAEHRARLIETLVGPLLVGREYADPAAAFAALEAATRVMAVQAGEPGPLAQAVAGLDIALWDLVARRAGKPLWAFLGGVRDTVRVYASGLGPDAGVAIEQAKRLPGCTAFKLKIGFGRDADLANLAAVRRAVGGHALMVDANQAWTREQACAIAPDLAPFHLQWLEEPIVADAPAADWAAVAAASPAPLAGGENLRGRDVFAQALAGGALRVIQSDLAKWGGFSGCLPVARAALAAGRRYCPHFLGGGIGLLASAHLLAAAGGDGLLEYDAQDNALREGVAKDFPRVADGEFRLPDRPGLGITPDLDALERLRVAA